MIRTKLSSFPRRRESRTMDHIKMQQSILNWYISIQGKQNAPFAPGGWKRDFEGRFVYLVVAR
jgi:hypothetical protein